MIENIKSMFRNMNEETRTAALEQLKTEFKLASHKEVKNKWIIGGRIPEENQERIVQLFQFLLNKQYRTISEIIVHAEVVS